MFAISLLCALGPHGLLSTAWAGNPTASNGSATTAEDTAVAITLRASDPDGDAMTYLVGTSPAHGSVVIDGSRATYTPTANYAGSDSFTWRARDSAGGYSGYATINITITAVNDAPSVPAISASTDEDTNVTITLSASDPEGDSPLTYAISTAPAHGAATLSHGVVTYTPEANYNGADSFAYTATDPKGATSTPGTVTVTIASINDPPTATSQSVSVDENSNVLVTLDGTDVEGHSLAYAIASSPRHGTAALSGKKVRYTPDADYFGSDTFTFSVSDGVYTATGTVSITVVQTNHAPVATSGRATTAEDTPVTIALNATDADGNPITLSVVRAPTHGAVVIAGTQATYTPSANWNGSDSFTWKAYDGALYSATATTTLTISAVNDAPVAANVSANCDEDGSTTVRLSSTDVDARTSPTYSLVSGASHGTLILGSTTVAYRPTANWSGTDTFTYRASDGVNVSNVATATVTVRPINDAPTAYASYGQMPANGDETFPAERSDIDSASVSWVVDTQPNHGRVYASSTGFRYTPTVGYFGKDRWQWHAYDGAASSATVTLEVNIHPPPSTEGRPEMPQIGLNKIQFGLGATAGDLDSATLPYRPDSIFDGFRDLGVQIFRQAARGDLVWSTVELTEGNFSDADANQIVAVPDVEPTCTLFEIQYAAPTPPWCEDISEFQKFMGPDAYDYLDHVLANYGDSVGYYELGNEMYHWVAADPPVDNPDVLPGCYPTDGYSPSEQAVFIEEASRYIKEGDPGAVLTLSSVATDSDQAYAWLEDVMSTTGSTDWFDVVSYHAYDNWGRAYGTRDNFATELAALGLQDKLVKLTEYGSTSDADYTDRTDYPNSPETQCADVFRETLIGFGYGDATTIWHTYLPVTSAATGGEFQGFELVEYDGTWKPAAYTYQLLANELIPFKEITNYSTRTQYVYKVTTTDDEDRWVFWADGTSATIPSGMTEYTSVYPNSDGTFDWIPVSPGDQVPLTDTPILVR